MIGHTHVLQWFQLVAAVALSLGGTAWPGPAGTGNERVAEGAPADFVDEIFLVRHARPMVAVVGTMASTTPASKRGLSCRQCMPRYVGYNLLNLP
jgi:hypothetical protein